MWTIINELLEKNQLLGTASILTIVTTIFYSLKSVPSHIYSFIKYKFIKTININNLYGDNVINDVMYYLNLNYSKYMKNYRYEPKEINTMSNSLGITSFKDNKEYIKNFKIEKATFVIWKKFIPILVSINKNKNEGAENLSSMYERYITIKTFNKKVLIDFFDEIHEFSESIKIKKSKPKFYLPSSSYSGWGSTKKVPNKNIDNYFYNNSLKEDIINDIQNFLNSKKWYEDRNLSYKRSYGLHGPPGNGKSSLVFAIAQKFGLDIFYFTQDLFKSDGSFIDKIDDLAYHINEDKPVILLFEDFDILTPTEKRILDDNVGKLETIKYEDRGRNITKERKNNNNFTTSLSTILNFLDGSLSLENTITFFTTNDIESLDKAVLRSGRMDKKILLENPNKDTIINYLEHFYETKIDNTEELELKEKFNMADVQVICLDEKEIIGLSKTIDKLFIKK